MGRVAVFSIGCKVNQGECEELKMGLAEAGHRIAGDPAAADLCIVNTCTVTAESDHKCRKLIRSLARRGARAIAVAGCYAEVDRGALESLPRVVAVIPNSEKGGWMQRILDLLDGASDDDGQAFLSRTRAFIKIQDGCERGCSYCVVPRARGHEWSRPAEEVVTIARKWLSQGTRELVLCGINLGRYRIGSLDLAGLVTQLLSLGGGFRIRLSSIELEDMDASWLVGWAESDSRICPHLHFPLQSGDEDILNDMGRGYTPAQFIEACKTVRRRWQRVTLTTEVIAGYPGESEEAFQATINTLSAMRPSRLHVFPFSKRPGTRAWHKEDTVAPESIAARACELRRLAQQWRLGYTEGRIGGTAELLVERIVERDGRTALGTTEDYIKGVLLEPAWEVRPGSLVRGSIIEFRDGLAVMESRGGEYSGDGSTGNYW
jgi:threonylcarbamoyladenosine tRNA methylthiotransferase MtaB